MKILAILLAAVAVAGAINPAAIYRSRCSEGTSYWCLGVAEADECGAVEYCIQNVWRGQSVQESPACSNCEAFVNGVRNVLEQTSVQEEILQGAKLACTVMGSLASTCENVVDTLGPELLKTLVTELTADKVCALLKFCPGSSLQSPNDDEICTVCKDFMSAANAMVSNATLQQEVEDTILALCPLLETFIPNCAETVKTDFPIIVQLLLTYLKPSTCVDLGVCTSNSPARQFIQKVMKIKSLRNVDESQLCSNCMTYVGDLDVFLSNPPIQEAVILGLDQLCYTLGAPLSMLCKYAVNTYTKPIFAELVTILNPQTFCPRIGFCPSLSLPKVSKMRPSLGDDCVDCEALIKDIDGMLMNQTVQNMIIQELDDLCEQLGTFSAQCKSYVDQYAELVFDTIASFLDPDQVCQTIGFCQSRIWNKLSQKLHSKAPGDTCSDCEAFIKDIDGLLTNTTVQHIIIEELDAFCSQLGSFAAQCKSYVDDFAPLVFSELATLLDPQTVCQGIGFCSSTTSLPRRMPFKVFKADPALCSDCKNLITDVDGMLSNQTVQQMILAELQTFCQYAGSYQLECKLLIQTYGPTVFQYLETALVSQYIYRDNPDTVCTEIGFCTSDAAPAQV
ncbi:prosaposin-like [Diadema setosum]|uniref:prosaposin-like n=1 Tax=Diadema setosum TaxID=31175 RepID=UPI003B3A2D6B